MLQMGIGWRAVLCGIVVLLMWPAARLAAEEAAPARTGGGIARPSVEELAVPPQKPAEEARETDTREAMCLMIESAAKANDLPLEFFARVIWQESRLQSDAVGPLTRRGERALGIAQFMLRDAALAAGCAAFFATRRSIFAGVVSGEILMLAGKWWLG